MLVLLGVAAAVAAVELRVSYNSARSSALPLQGAMIDAAYEEMYVFTTEEPGIGRVYFYLDTPNTGNYYHSEGGAPFDFAGTRGGQVPEPFQIEQLANGEHFIEIRVTFMDGREEVARSTFTVQGSWTDTGGAAPTFTLVHTNADRSNPQPLSGAALTGNAYIALDDGNIEIIGVNFYLDNNGGPPDKIERAAPYDFRGGSPNPNPLDTKTLSDGQHTMRAFVDTKRFGVIEAGVAVFIVRNTGPSLTVDASIVGFDHIFGDPDPAGKTVTVSATSGAGVVFTVSGSGSWLAVPTAGTTPGTLPLNAVTTGLAVGYYSTVVTASAMGHHSVTFEAFLSIKPRATPAPSTAVPPPPTPAPSTLVPTPAPPTPAPMHRYTIMVALRRDKADGEPLDGKSWAPGIDIGVYIYITPEEDVKQVQFFFNVQGGEPFQTENRAPYDFRGSNPGGFDLITAAMGVNTIWATVNQQDGSTENLVARFTIGQVVSTPAPSTLAPTPVPSTLVPTPAPSTLVPITPPTPAPLTLVPTQAPSTLAPTMNKYTIMVATQSDKSDGVPLDGMMLGLNTAVYVYVLPEDNVQKVLFYLNVQGSRPYKTENNAPYDLKGGDPWDLKDAKMGANTIWVDVLRSDGGATEHLSATFTVGQVPTPVPTPMPSTIVPTPVPSTLEPTPVPATLAPTPIPATPAPPSVHVLMVASKKDKTDAVPLDGNALFNKGAYIFVSPEADVLQVQFFLNVQGEKPYQTENVGPYDFRGGKIWDLKDAAVGANTIWATVLRTDTVPTEYLVAQFNVDKTLNHGSALVVSPTAFHGGEVLMGQVLTFTLSVNLAANPGKQLPFTATSSSWVKLAVRSNMMTNETVQVTIQTASLPAGKQRGQIVVANPSLVPVEVPVIVTVIDPDVLVLVPGKKLVTGRIEAEFEPAQTVQVPVDNAYYNPGSTSFTASANVAWVKLGPGGVTPGTLAVTMDPTGLVKGTYTGIVTISAPGYVDGTVNVVLEIWEKDPCWPVICSQIRVPLPYTNSFNTDQGHILDKNGVGTGLTHILTPAAGKGTGYVQNNLEMDLANGHLKITTTAGIHHTDNNNADNNIGIGYAGPNSVAIVQCTLVKPVQVPTTGGYEQAGLYLGWDQNNYVKLTYVSTPNKGHIIEFAMELAGVRSRRVQRGLTLGADEDLTLRLVVDPFALTVASSFARSRAPGKFQGITTWNEIPDEFYSYDAAGIDPIIGTRTFTGIWATHRNGPAPVTYTFSDFSVTKPKPTQPPTEPKCGGATFEFDRKSYSVPLPTAMVWGPDGRLYVAELFGRVHALTYNKKMNVVNDEVIKTLEDAEGKRMTLGITIGPDSTAGSIDLYLCHSSASVQNGGLNSGMVTRLYGTGFRQYTHVITGLPRAIANHGPNGLHFGRDRKLYIAIGGNTGAGSLTEAKTEFRDRPEQPLSAAIVVADVFKAGFNGACHATTTAAEKVLGDPKCDVEAYGTGLRNSYDFVQHSNGQIYATDNGLGVTGAYPPQTTGDCGGAYTKSDTKNWKEGGNNPGAQTDWLFIIKKGKYYGHPNPSRKECIFMDGSFQNVSPAANYERPIADLGKHASANGIIEYQGDAGGGYLKGALLYTRYSAGDDVVAIILSEDGTKAENMFTLAKDFVDPLTLTQNDKGDLFVAEFGANQVTALRPKGQCTERKWQTLPVIPKATLDPASASVGSKLFVIGGKQGNAHFNTAYSYDVGTKKWKKIADKPGSAVENAACVGFRGKVYHFGGSEEPFSKAVNEAFVFDVATGVWSAVAALPTARGGAVAEVVGDEIYVIGGMLASGVSVTTVEIYKPSTNTWRTGVPLQEVRDNPGAEVIDGKIYVIGGRHRQDGREVDGTKASCEVFDPATKKWTYIAPMPTGRRTMVTGVMGGQLYSIGGERNRKSTNELFNVNERYDPATNKWTALAAPPNARHGAAYSVIGGTLYVVGGGLVAGSSATDLFESV